jgi:hypothetical protein
MNKLEMKVLNILAKEFEYTQGLHVEISKLQRLMELKKELDPILLALEEQDMVSLYKEGEKIKLAKITWRGLNEVGEVSLKYGLGKDYYKNYDIEI